MYPLLICVAGIGFVSCFVLIWRTVSEIQRVVRTKQLLNVKKIVWRLGWGDGGMFLSFCLMDLSTFEKIEIEKMMDVLGGAFRAMIFMLVSTIILVGYAIWYNQIRKKNKETTTT
ncbi:MAG: hypothetical protein ACOX7N_04190 [Lawsonibacter sp.]|jgi:hypothetical protein